MAFLLRSNQTTTSGYLLRSNETTGVAFTLLWGLDSANIDSTVFTVVNGATSEPAIYLKVRLTDGDPFVGSPRWIHWHFGISGLTGKRPIIEIETTGRHLDATYDASWRPVYTEDFTAWTPFGSFTALTTPYRVRFQPAEAFTADTVYFADHAVFRIADFDALATSLAADVSGLVSVSAEADASGVIGVSPAETDENARAIGGHNLYGFVLGDDSPTSDGASKRWMAVDCGTHSGEVLDGWALQGIVDFYLNGVGALADRLRANWKIGLYFPLTPNGRYGGHWRTNFRTPTDPNRDWEDFTLAESVLVRDAILADLPAQWDITLSLHTAASQSVTENLYYSDSANATLQTLWMGNLDTADSATWQKTSFPHADSVNGWAAARSVPIATISEFGTRTTDTVARYQQCGQRYLEATAISDANGVFRAVSLSVEKATHGHSVESPSLTQAHVLALADSLHGHNVESPTLLQAHVLNLSDALHGHSVEAPTLTVAGSLAVADAIHAHSADAVPLTQAYVLVTADTVHSHSSDALKLSSGLNLAVADALHAHTAETPGLTQAHVLSLADALHGHSVDSVAMGQGYSLIVAGASHSHSVESPTVSVAFVLAIQDALHSQAADTLALATHITLVVSDALHAHLAGSASEISLPTGDRIFLVAHEDRLFLVAT